MMKFQWKIKFLCKQENNNKKKLKEEKEDQRNRKMLKIEIVQNKLEMVQYAIKFVPSGRLFKQYYR